MMKNRIKMILKQLGTIVEKLFGLFVLVLAMCYMYMCIGFELTIQNVLIMNNVGIITIFFLIVYVGYKNFERIKKMEQMLTSKNAKKNKKTASSAVEIVQK